MLKIKRFVGVFFKINPFFPSYGFTSFLLFIQFFFFFFFRLCTYTMLMYYRGHFLCSGSCYIARVTRAVYFYSQNGINHMKKKRERARETETGRKNRGKSAETPWMWVYVCARVLYTDSPSLPRHRHRMASRSLWMAFSYYFAADWGNVKLLLVSSPRPNVCRHIKH